MRLPRRRKSAAAMESSSVSPLVPSLSEVQALEFAGGISEVLHLDAHAIHHAQVKIAHRSFAAVDDTAAGLDFAAAVSGNESGKIFVKVPVAVGEPCPVNDHRIIQQR